MNPSCKHVATHTLNQETFFMAMSDEKLSAVDAAHVI